MRIAVTGTHGSGKTTLIEDFLERHPRYEHEPEPYLALAQNGVAFADGPIPQPAQIIPKSVAGDFAADAPRPRLLALHEGLRGRRSLYVDHRCYAFLNDENRPPMTSIVGACETTTSCPWSGAVATK